jgi:hypothetical protein
MPSIVACAAILDMLFTLRGEAIESFSLLPLSLGFLRCLAFNSHAWHPVFNSFKDARMPLSGTTPPSRWKAPGADRSHVCSRQPENSPT